MSVRERPRHTQCPWPDRGHRGAMPAHQQPSPRPAAEPHKNPRHAVTVRHFDPDGTLTDEHVEERVIYRTKDGRAYIRVLGGRVFLISEDPFTVEYRWRRPQNSMTGEQFLADLAARRAAGQQVVVIANPAGPDR